MSTHADDVAEKHVARSSTFQPADLWTGKDLDSAGRLVWKEQQAVLALAATLADESYSNLRIEVLGQDGSLDSEQEAWWRYVDQVRQGAVSLDIAGAYGKGKRREPIRRLLELAATANQTLAFQRMIGLARVWTVEEWSRGSYCYRPEFFQLVTEGASYIARPWSSTLPSLP